MMPKLPGAALLRRLAAGLMLLAATTVAGWVAHHDPATAAGSAIRLTLVVPDGGADDDVHVLAWQDAAAELGFPLEVVGASQWMRRHDSPSGAALILPDTLHRRMNDALVEHLTRVVRGGARLMLVHDAGVMGMDGRYHPQQSRLSALAGVRYALYRELQTGMLSQQGAAVDRSALPLLRLPPGKLVRERDDSPLTSAQRTPTQDEELSVVSYQYGRLHYPVYVTRGEFDGERLMHAGDGSLLAGVRRVGAGQVLFVNLPLTFLKLRTDGFFLHGFLRYFAQDLAHLPQLAAVPDGKGAIVMNWHVDSAAALPAMEKLAALGAFGQGPYSVHFTAGPDVDVPGDGGGMDLANNTVMRSWVSQFAKRGDEIGSHGGWIHNEFGRVISTQAPARSTELIERNSAVVSQASGRPVREYSAPTGNHPAWVTPWLHDRGINAYYFTGDIGMAPTRSYQDGHRGPPDMWAFPVLSYGRYAAFEEARANHIPESSLAAWLHDVADYCADYRTVRLVYFHPPGVVIFPEAFRQWLRHTADLVRDGRLRWMTMTQFADYANRRLQVQWQLQDDAANPGSLRLEARHAESLEHMSWVVPIQHYREPRVVQGSAEVVRDGTEWRITAGRGARLTLVLQRAAASRAPARSLQDKES